MVSEGEIEEELVKQVRRMDGRCYKWVSPGNRGVPDRIVVLPEGVVVFVELKRKDGRVTALQERQIDRLLDMGCDARVVRGVEGLCGFLASVGVSEGEVERIRKRMKE